MNKTSIFTKPKEMILARGDIVYVNNLISRERFWEDAIFYIPTNQICLKTKKALDCMKFIKYKIMKIGDI